MIGAVPACTAIVVIALFPKPLSHVVDATGTSAVSLAFKRLLVATDPANVSFRISLARSEMDAGDLDATERTLAPAKGAAGVEALSSRLQRDRWQALPSNGAARLARKRGLVDALLATIDQPTIPDDLAFRAETALALSRPDLAASLYLKVAVATRAS